MPLSLNLFHYQFFAEMTKDKTQFLEFGKLSAAAHMAGLANKASKFADVNDHSDWDVFLQDFQRCHETLLRQDATTVIYPLLKKELYQGEQMEKKVADNPSMNDELQQSPIFRQQYLDTLKACQLQQVMSIIRPYALSDRLNGENTAAEAL